jgi:Ca2+-binding RTX toxin-like protein
MSMKASTAAKMLPADIEADTDLHLPPEEATTPAPVAPGRTAAQPSGPQALLNVIVGTNGADLLYGTGGDDAIYGLAGNDLVVGGDGSDYVYGGNDRDTIEGNGGADYLFGEQGDDFLYGGEGDDYLSGGPGVDFLFGEGGNDWIDAGSGAALINGGTGFDSVTYLYSNGPVVVNVQDPSQSYGDAAGHVYFDIEQYYMSQFDDRFYGSDAAEIVRGWDGQDFLIGYGGTDEIWGGNGNDIISGGDDRDQLYGEAGADQIFGDGGNDDIYGGEDNDQLHGGDGSDVLIGEGGADLLRGGAGDDYLHGGEGDDTLTDEPIGFPSNDGNDTFYGNAGNDILFTGVGDDTLEGGAGADTLLGGEGFDTAAYVTASAAVTVDLNNPAAGTGDAAGDTFEDIEAFRLSGYDDTLHGTDAAETVYGMGGNDTLWGAGGDDHLYGDRTGSHFNSGGADVIHGDDGNDTIEGGRGADGLWGGRDADLFVYRFTSDSRAGDDYGIDRINDFASGEDLIDLSLVDANEALAGNQDFTFLKKPGTYSGDWTGMVWTTTKYGITTVFASTDADGDAEMQIVLTGNMQLTANDFIL